jgi:hypothetical protein
MKQKVIEIFEKQGIDISDVDYDGLVNAIQETLEAIADDTEEKEPHATVSIRRYRDVAMNIYNDLNS